MDIAPKQQTPEFYAFWNQHVEAFKASGLSYRAYAEQYGLNYRTLQRHATLGKHQKKRFAPEYLAFWDAHIQALRQSGLSCRAYAKQQGLSYSTLQRQVNRAEQQATQDMPKRFSPEYYEFWLHHVQAFKESGLSCRAYAEQKGLKYNTLQRQVARDKEAPDALRNELARAKRREADYQAVTRQLERHDQALSSLKGQIDALLDRYLTLSKEREALAAKIQGIDKGCKSRSKE